MVTDLKRVVQVFIKFLEVLECRLHGRWPVTGMGHRCMTVLYGCPLDLCRMAACWGAVHGAAAGQNHGGAVLTAWPEGAAGGPWNHKC